MRITYLEKPCLQFLEYWLGVGVPGELVQFLRIFSSDE
jgi:hypothetical protein